MAFICSEFSDVTDSWRCKACGCSNARACPGGCFWVDDNKCSRCFDADGRPFAFGDAEDDSPLGIEYCPAAETPAPHVPLFVTPTDCKCARCHVRLAA
jgi:hypothetical protein